ncbi:hypothetical protein [Pseudoxanthomonas sp. PXM04]|jgi:hypothetical protein|uniref:hypothetical protein n=1 Tax=unclassified Pseudoxanthomonas TaxID=2645906 RepID=UPI001780FF6F|nr:hypothetical protein [Pseudoxanthomonas sp. PXM04]MBD9377620.1 hypothetical protein [Pseudoxanthomonas sp. PXM04]
MMEEILKAIGTSAVVPIASIAVAGYAITMLTGLHRTKSQQRTEFLGLWKGVEQMDDMALEVATRHLCGTYLPAGVIRRICASDHCADGIFQVAQLWPLYQYDPVGRTVVWAKSRYATAKGLAVTSFLHTLGYFLLALSAVGFLVAAVSGGPKSLFAWICGVNSVLFVFLAFIFLSKAETFTLAKKEGARWLERLTGGNGSEHSSATAPNK